MMGDRYQASRLEDLVRLDDVRVVETSREARLAEKHGAKLVVAAEASPQNLEDDELL